MRILAVASDKAELTAFDPERYIRIVCGIGPVLAAAVSASAIAAHSPDAVVSVGSAGSFGSLAVGECVSFGSVVMPDQDLTAFRLGRGRTLLPSKATIGELRLDRSSDLILSTSSAFASGPPIIPAHAADMEAYGVAAAAYLAGVPCFAVKVITDIVGSPIRLSDYGFTLRSLRSLLPERVEEVLKQL